MGSWGVMSLRRLMVLMMVMMMASWGATATATSGDDRLNIVGRK